MKKIMYVVVALMLLGIVAATPSSAPVVDCGTNSWYDWDAGDCKAYEIQPVVDELHQADLSIESDIENNRISWLTDNKGVSMNRVIDLLYGDYLEMLKGLFVSSTIYETEIVTLQDQVSSLTKQVYYMNDGYSHIYENGGFLYGTNEYGTIVRLV